MQYLKEFKSRTCTDAIMILNSGAIQAETNKQTSQHKMYCQIQSKSTLVSLFWHATGGRIQVADMHKYHMMISNYGGTQAEMNKQTSRHKMYFQIQSKSNLVNLSWHAMCRRSQVADMHRCHDDFEFRSYTSRAKQANPATQDALPNTSQPKPNS
jgi:adenine-specific DNA methylase